MTIFAQADLTAATNNSVFTSSDTNGDVVNILLCNRNSSAVAVSIYLVPNGTSSPATKHAIEYGLILDGNCRLERTGIPLGSGDQIFINPASSGISASVVGLAI